MVNTLIELLESFNYPVYRQGSMQDDEAYPDTFITFWNVASEDVMNYDNDARGTAWYFNVNTYSNDPDTTYELLDEIISALKENGWLVGGKGRDLASDEPTHTGRGIDVIYLETNN